MSQGKTNTTTKSAGGTAKGARKSAPDAVAALCTLTAAQRTAAAKIAGCTPEEVIGHREYEDHHIVVVHTSDRVRKQRVEKKAG